MENCVLFFSGFQSILPHIQMMWELVLTGEVSRQSYRYLIHVILDLKISSLKLELSQCDHGQMKPKTMKLVFVASQLGIKHCEVRTKTG
jgi:hypothetical protein